MHRHREQESELLTYVAEEEDEDVSDHLDKGVPGALGRPDVHGPPQQPEPAQTGFALARGPWSYSIGLSQFDIS